MEQIVVAIAMAVAMAIAMAVKVVDTARMYLLNMRGEQGDQHGEQTSVAMDGHHDGLEGGGRRTDGLVEHAGGAAAGIFDGQQRTQTLAPPPRGSACRVRGRQLFR